MGTRGYIDNKLMHAAIAAERAQEEKMPDDKFEERMIKSARDRRMAAARAALGRLQATVEYSLKALDKGDIANISLIENAIRAQEAFSELLAIDEIVEIFKTTREG